VCFAEYVDITAGEGSLAGVTIRDAQAADLAAIGQLLWEVGLPTGGVADHIAGFAVAEEAGRIVATAGLERHGRSALLRSVAAHPAYRGRGIPRRLVARLLQRAARQGVAEVFLLTTGAAGYFRRFGFEPVARGDVAPAVRQSTEFGDECCATAQPMRLRIGRGEEVGRP